MSLSAGRLGATAYAGTQDDAVPARRLKLLADTAHDLLTNSEPREFLARLFQRLDSYCGLEACFSYRVEGDHLRLAYCTGIPDGVAQTIDRLEFGEAVCGTVAQRQLPIAKEHVQDDDEPSTSLIRSLGMQAYCCHPLIANGALLGTLSYGTRTRPRFTADEISLMNAVSGQVALAMERILYMRRLAAQNDDLTRANERLEQFAHGASHDLKEPVRTMRNYSQLLSRRIGRKLQEEDQQLLEFVANAALRLDDLIDGLLALIRIETGPVSATPVDANEVFGDVLHSCRALLDESQAEVEVDVLPRGVLADPSQLGQVFQNLIANAVKYRRPEGYPRIRVCARRDESCATFSVEDNGQGIPAEHRESIFVPFRRLHDRSIAGAGLGLAIAERIVQRHGGRIWVESEPGVGSTFFFSIPATEQGER